MIIWFYFNYLEMINFQTKLRSWIDQSKLNYRTLSENPNAIPFFEKNPHLIEWNCLSRNPNAIKLLEENIDKINWYHIT
jgi:hypothetical protein